MVSNSLICYDYVYDGNIIRQKGGGSIGLDLTGVVADIYIYIYESLELTIQTETHECKYGSEVVQAIKKTTLI